MVFSQYLRIIYVRCLCFPGKAVNTPLQFNAKFGALRTYLKRELIFIVSPVGSRQTLFPQSLRTTGIRERSGDKIWKDSHIWKL